MRLLRPRRDAVIAGLVALALAAWACWPMPLHPAQVVLGEKGVQTWALSVWMMDQPLREWVEPTIDWMDFPDGGRHAVLVGLPQVFVARLLRPLLGPVLAVNVSQWLHVALGIYAGARLARRALPDRAGAAGRAASLAGGATAGLSCIVLSALGNGQPENLGVGYLLFAADGAWRFLATGRRRHLASLAGGTLLAWLSSPYLLMGPLVGCAVLILPALRRHLGRTLIAAGVVAGISAPMVAHFQPARESAEGRILCPAALDPDVPGSRQARLPEDLGRILRGTPSIGRELLVADPAALFRPGRRPPGDDHLPLDYLGWLPTGAALVACRRSRSSRWLAAAGALTLLLALGPRLMFNGWAIGSPHPVPLPLSWLQGLPVAGPLFAAVQVPGRLLFGTTLFMGLAGLPTWLALARRLPDGLRGGLLLTLLAASPALEQLLVGPAAPPMPVLFVQPADAHRALAAFDDARGLLEVPPLGWDPARPAMVDAHGTIVPPPVQFQRLLVRGWPTHRHPLAITSCPGQGFLNPAVAHSAFADAITAILAGESAAGGRSVPDLGATAGPLVDLGVGWLIIHTGSGLIRPEAEQRLLAVARQQLELVAAGADGSYLFRLPEPSP